MNACVADVPPITRFAEHGGSGPILFRRLIETSAFEAPVDFVDYTTIPPGSVIGRHQHVGNEEMYFVLEGRPLVTVENDAQRLAVGSLSIVRNGQSHELINDTTENVTILVVQVRT